MSAFKKKKEDKKNSMARHLLKSIDSKDKFRVEIERKLFLQLTYFFHFFFFFFWFKITQSENCR